MKKLAAVLLSLCILLCVSIAETVPAEPVVPAEETFVFLIEIGTPEEPISVSLSMDQDFAPALALLGEPLGYFESESCAFQGLDKVYTYPSFIISTYPQDGLDRILSIYLMDDMVTTSEGAYIGMHLDEVSALYGEPTSSADQSATYEKGGCALAFICDADGYVTAITYTSVAASAQ